jgi:hypothetical protein
VNDRRLQDWLLHVFDHPVSEPEWWWAADAAVLRLPPEEAVEAVARLFEEAGSLLDGLPDDRAAQGFWYLVSAADYLKALQDPELEAQGRLRVINGIEALFRGCFAKRTAPVLGHLREPGAAPLNEVCYLWWDAVPFSSKFWGPEAGLFGKACLAVMERQLGIPHDAVRESALLGLGHWQPEFPHEVRRIVRAWMDATPGVRAELLDFAAGAAQGVIS